MPAPTPITIKLRRFVPALALLLISIPSYARICGPFDRATMVEFFNTNLGHYFYTTDCIDGEIEFVESGGAGLGWSRTGWAFGVRPSNGLNVLSVDRFYGSVYPGPNSHLYSFDNKETSFLLALEKTNPPDKPRWNIELGGSIGVEPRELNSGNCPGRAAVRFYNRGFERGKDANHRFVAEQATDIRASMLAQGWVEEGAVFCPRPTTFKGIEK